MSRWAKSKWLSQSGLLLLFFSIVPAFFFDRHALKEARLCDILKKKTVSVLVQPDSGKQSDLDLLEPVALVVARKRLDKLVEKHSQLDCAVILYRLWRDSKEMERP